MVTSSPSTLTSTLKILFIEDNDISRQLMSDFLVDCGYEVMSLAEASLFSCVMSQFQPTLILLDLKLPGVDGYELLKLLQQTPEWQHIPVIIISAFAFQSDQQRAFDLGARQYLVKPIQLHELTDAIFAEIACPRDHELPNGSIPSNLSIEPSGVACDTSGA